jgi:ceramide glucosyltransferase
LFFSRVRFLPLVFDLVQQMHMPIWFHIVCSVVIAGWLAAAWLSWFQVHQFAGKFRDKSRPKRDAYRPTVTIIMPIKGVDKDLPGCIKGLCTQDYPGSNESTDTAEPTVDNTTNTPNTYRVVIVFESEDDPAVPIVKQELAKYEHRESAIMIAGKAPSNVGQKVHNQLHVIDQLEPDADDEEVWVFADSDAIPGPGFLVDLVSVLASKHSVAVTTGYRWLVPESDVESGEDGSTNSASTCDRFWTNIASVINSSIACSYRRGGRDIAWGGAMAMRVAIARQGELRKRLTGALTDDYPITTMSRDLGLRVRFVKRCLAPTPVQFSFLSFATFARRQYLITRIYAPKMYYAALGLLTFWLIGFATTWTHLVLSIIHDSQSYWWALSSFAVVSAFVSHQLRATQRQKIVKLAFHQKVCKSLTTALRMDRWLTPVCMLTHWIVVVAALWGNRFTWRGIRYQLRGPQDVQRFD